MVLRLAVALSAAGLVLAGWTACAQFMGHCLHPLYCLLIHKSIQDTYTIVHNYSLLYTSILIFMKVCYNASLMFKYCHE